MNDDTRVFKNVDSWPSLRSSKNKPLHSTLIWWFMSRQSSKKIPKFVAVFAIATLSFPILKVVTLMSSIFLGFNKITSVLSSFSFNLLSTIQFLTSRVQSSTARTSSPMWYGGADLIGTIVCHPRTCGIWCTCLVLYVPRVPVYKVYSKGLNTEPWGTPNSKACDVDSTQLTNTACVLIHFTLQKLG